VKLTPEIAAIRHVPMGQDVISPAGHSAFSTPIELLQFMDSLKELSGGKPVGFKLCIGDKSEFLSICKAMLETGLTPDFITIDGSEGGTGAAPIEMTNSVGTPLREGLLFVHNALVGIGLRNDIRLIASGKAISAFHMIRLMALGADTVNSARAMMMALGCIRSETMTFDGLYDYLSNGVLLSHETVPKDWASAWDRASAETWRPLQKRKAEGNLHYAVGF